MMRISESRALGLARSSDRPQDGAPDKMRKIGFKALAAILTVGSRSKKHVDWTLTIAIFSTIVTLSLIALYFLQGSGDF